MTKYIAFEGIDGAGKTIQSRLLCQSLLEHGFSVVERSYPVYKSVIGREIYRMLHDGQAATLDAKSMALWYALDRLADYRGNQGLFERADYVLFNRYTLTNRVYQSIRGGDPAIGDWIDTLEHGILRLPQPDLYLILDVPIEVSQENNRRKDKDSYEQDLELQRQVRKGYLSAAIGDSSIRIISCYQDGALLPPPEITEIVLQTVKSAGLLYDTGETEIGKLRARMYELEQRQRLITDASRRAYKLWREKHLGEAVMPDATDLMVWLMEQVEGHNANTL